MGTRSGTSRKEEKTTSHLTKMFIVAAVAAVLYFVILAVFSLAALNSGLSQSMYMPTGIITGALTGFLNGFFAVRPIKEKGALYGLITGVIQMLICAAVLFAVNGMSAGNGIFILIAIIILFSVIGGISAVNMKIKKKY